MVEAAYGDCSGAWPQPRSFECCGSEAVQHGRSALRRTSGLHLRYGNVWACAWHLLWHPTSFLLVISVGTREREEGNDTL